MSTTNKRGRRPTNFYWGRIPNANLEFIKNQESNDFRKIQKEYHNKYGKWIRESTIENALNRMASTESQSPRSRRVESDSNITIKINYNGNGYTLEQYTELIRVETKREIANQLTN